MRLIRIFLLFIFLVSSLSQAKGQTEVFGVVDQTFYGHAGWDFLDPPSLILENIPGQYTSSLVTMDNQSSNLYDIYILPREIGEPPAPQWLSIDEEQGGVTSCTSVEYLSSGTADGGYKKTVVYTNELRDIYYSVSQRDNNSEFNVSEQTIHVGPLAEEINIQVTSLGSNYTYEIVEDYVENSILTQNQTWLSAAPIEVPISGNNFKFTVEAFNGTGKRVGQVHFYLGNMLIAVNVIQSSNIEIDFSTDNLIIPDDENSGQITLTSNSSIPWNVTNGTTFFDISPASGTFSRSTPTNITIASNHNTVIDIEQTITFEWFNPISNQTESHNVKVTVQSPPGIIVSPHSNITVEYEADEELYTIISNRTWSVSENETWLHLGNVTRDGNNGTQNIIFDRYVGDGDPRIGTISFKTDDYDDWAEEIKTITQASPLVFTGANSLEFVDVGETHQFSLLANIEWKVVSAPRWITLDVLSGTTTGINYNVNVTAKPNNIFAERTGNIIILGIIGEDVLVTKHIPITQAIPSLTAFTSSTPDKNYISTTVYGEDERIIGQSIQYSDNLGKPIQSISRNMSENSITVAQTLYDDFGRPNVSTMAIPMNQTSFQLRDNFATGTYNIDGFWVPDNSDELLDYYSNDNTNEPYVPNDAMPYSEVVYSQRIPGAVSQSYGVGEATANLFTTGFTVSASPDELYMHPLSATGNVDLTTLKIKGGTYSRDYFKGMSKAVSRDVIGKEGVTYYDAEGRVIASCISGESGGANITATYAINSNANTEGGFIDIHLPNNKTTTYTITKSGSWDCDVINLVDENLEYEGTASTLALAPGFYRIIAYSATEVSITTTLGYKYYSFSAYDEAGRLLRTISPKDVEELQGATTSNTVLDAQCSQNTYNSLGWLLSSYSQDEGETNYMYRKDGKIRFSQNAQQELDNKFSYTNYDKHGRIVQVGEVDNDLAATNFLDGANFESSTTLDGLLEYDYTTEENIDKSTTENPPEYFDQTFTYYSKAEHTAPKTQNFLRGKVAETRNANVRTWYSYTYDGMVEWVIQEIKGFDLDKDGIINDCQGTIKDTDDLVTLDYTYDFIGNVTEVIYQKNKDDEFTHLYTYDLDNRLIRVETQNSDDPTNLQAQYYYYPHGPLKRVELGNNVQGTDYVYNIQGLLKSINNPYGTNSDPGQDGIDGRNANFAPDAFAMGLDYYSGDYSRTGINIPSSGTNYNGNIAKQYWINPDIGIHVGEGWGGTDSYDAWSYSYDERNYLGTATFGNYNFYPAAPLGEIFTADASNAYNVYGDATGNIRYDANGNIKNLQRNAEAGVLMDNLSYEYKTGTNKLDYINDAHEYVVPGVDYGSNTSAQYTYNKIGQLINNDADKQWFEYDVYGKTTKVYKETASSVSFLADYVYDDRGFRVKKHDHNTGLDTYYVRDISGNIITTYTQNTGADIARTEVPIYGSGRLGLARINTENSVENHVYELSDHLGNVRATIADNYDATIYKELDASITTTTDIIASNTIVLKPGFNSDNKSFTAKIDAVVTRAIENNKLLSATDYYPFGMQMPGRNYSLENYRFGYQGQFAEKDEETGYNQFEARLYDARIGRWLNTDPAGQYWSPYLGMANNPVSYVDPDGRYGMLSFINDAFQSGIFETRWDAFNAWQDFEGQYNYDPAGGDLRGLSLKEEVNFHGGIIPVLLRADDWTKYNDSYVYNMNHPNIERILRKRARSDKFDREMNDWQGEKGLREKALPTMGLTATVFFTGGLASAGMLGAFYGGGSIVGTTIKVSLDAADVINNVNTLSGGALYGTVPSGLINAAGVSSDSYNLIKGYPFNIPSLIITIPQTINDGKAYTND